jgi:hypothetical protein
MKGNLHTVEVVGSNPAVPTISKLFKISELEIVAKLKTGNRKGTQRQLTADTQNVLQHRPLEKEPSLPTCLVVPALRAAGRM